MVNTRSPLLTRRIAHARSLLWCLYRVAGENLLESGRGAYDLGAAFGPKGCRYCGSWRLLT